MLVVAVLQARPALAQAQSPRPSDLLAAVNDLRASQGLPPFKVDDALMASAQAHADYMASIHMITYYGADGSHPRERAIKAGFGSGETVFVAENIAMAQAASTPDYIVNGVWSGAENMDTMTNPQYVYAGAGVSEVNGQVYYTLDTGYIASENEKTPQVTSETNEESTSIPSPTMIVVHTAQPEENGSILHQVQTGEALWSIAMAYNVSVADLIAMNDLDPDNPIIYAGQKLLIRPAFTPTLSPTITQTSRPPTRTPRPTSTPRATRTPGPTFTATPKPIFPQVATLQKLDRRSLAVGIIVLCGLGLLVTTLSSIRPKN